MSLRWTEDQLTDYQTRNQELSDTHTPDNTPESVLQRKINKYCRDHGYPFVSFRKSKRAKGFLNPGTPDLIIGLPAGRTIWIELKDKSGRLSDDQKLFAKKLLFLKHEWYEVRSYKRFLEIIKTKGEQKMKLSDVKRSKQSQGKKELIKFLETGKITLKQAILAKCFECCNGYVDGKIDCQITDCPLHLFMPYQEGGPKKMTGRKLSQAHIAKMQAARRA